MEIFIQEPILSINKEFQNLNIGNFNFIKIVFVFFLNFLFRQAILIQFLFNSFFLMEFVFFHILNNKIFQSF